MGLFSIKPVRQQHVEVVQDLDQLIAEPIAFKLFGKTHLIEPLKTKEYLAVYDAWMNWDLILKRAKSDQPVTTGELNDGYFNIFSSVCKTITFPMVEEMTLHQKAALFALVLKTFMGETHTLPEITEKKNAQVS